MKKETLNIRFILRARSQGIVELKKEAAKKNKSASKLIREAVKNNYGIEL